MIIDVEDMFNRIELLESKIGFADQLNGELLRENASLKAQYRNAVEVVQSDLAILRTRVEYCLSERERIIAEQADIRSMLKRNYKLDVAAGVAEEIARQKRDSANLAAQDDLPRVGCLGM